MILIAAILFFLCLIAGIVLVVIEGLRFWRVLKRSMGAAGEGLGAIAMGGDAAAQAAAALDVRRAQLSEAQSDLALRAAVAARLGKAAGTGAVVVWWPLRFLMGR